jgi:geranylgeranyl pyrophosphate synthase
MSLRFHQWQRQAEEAILAATPAADAYPYPLHQAIHYALLNGGKRVRPMLVYATAELLGLSSQQVDPAAAAIEMIHAYSLVHDDLPAMDDDDLRRGKPTCHKAFDEATAILAGDALQALAFETLVRAAGAAQVRLRWIELLAEASGSAGMVGGQMIDLEAEQRTLDSDALQTMHRKKTGALIRASVMMGATPAEPDEETLHHLGTFADSIGLAFQVQDDILDVEGDSDTIGKPQGSDQVHGKSTFVTLYGIDGAKMELQKLHQQALQSLHALGQRSAGLIEIADFITQRHY